MTAALPSRAAYRRLPRANQYAKPADLIGPHALTPRQAAIVAFLGSHFARFQRFPTLREICELIGSTTPNGAVTHLRAIARKGAIVYRPGTRDASDGTIELPGLCELLAPAVGAVLDAILGRKS